MEGIDENEAKELQKADEEVRYREASMRYELCFVGLMFLILSFFQAIKRGNRKRKTSSRNSIKRIKKLCYTRWNEQFQFEY
jgi:hypothetical protein